MPSKPCGPLEIISPGVPRPTGFVINGHVHDFDHVTFVGAGRIRFECFHDDKFDVPFKTLEIEAGYPTSYMLIEKDIYHRLTVLRGPACYWCVYVKGQATIPAHDQVNRNPHIASRAN